MVNNLCIFAIQVLDHLLEEAGVGSTRQWTAVGCDGLPYALASRIIEEIYICPVCRRQYEQEEFQQHVNATTHATELEDGRKYRNILMLTGVKYCKDFMYYFQYHKKKQSFILTKLYFL